MFKIILAGYLIFSISLTGIFPPNVVWAQENEVYNLAVLDLTANGISLSEAASLTDYLRGQVARLITSPAYVKQTKITYTVVERGQMDKIFEEFDVQNTGCTDVSCAIEFGKMLNVERILIGSVGLVGQTYTISARLVDVETGKTESVADYLFTGERDNLLKEGIPTVVTELMYGQKQKKSKRMYYILGGTLVAGGVVAAILGSSGGKGEKTPTTGSIIFTLPDPTE